MGSSIRRTYQTPKLAGAFSGLTTFLKSRPNFKDRKEVENELTQLESFALHRPARKKFRRLSVLVPFSNETWQVFTVFNIMIY